MRGKKAQERIAISKTVKYVLLILIIAVILLWIINNDVYGFFSNISDYIHGRPPVNLTERVKIYGSEVEITLNDGKGKCVISDTFNLNNRDNEDDSWLKNYAVSGNDLYKKGALGWGIEETGIEWIPVYMIELDEEYLKLRNEEKRAMLEVNEFYSQVGTSEEELGGEWNAQVGFAIYMQDLKPSDLEFLDRLNENQKKMVIPVIDAVVMGIDPTHLALGLTVDSQFELIKAEVNEKEKYLIRSVKNKNLAINSGKFYVFENDNWRLSDINYPAGLTEEKIIDQIIKQELIRECYYGGDNRFKNATVYGDKVTLLLRDPYKKCIVYNSSDNELQHYGLKKTSSIDWTRELYELEEDLKWNDEIDGNIPTSEEVKEARIAHNLIQRDKELEEHLSNYDIKFCSNRKPDYEFCSFIRDLKSIEKEEVYTDKLDSYYIYEKGTSNSLGYLGKFIDNYIEESNLNNPGFRVVRTCDSSSCFLSALGENYGVKDGKILVLVKVLGEESWLDKLLGTSKTYEWKDFDKEKNKYVYMDQEEFNKLVKAGKIKQDLLKIRGC